MIAIIGDIYDQIVCQDLLKKDNISKNSVQAALKSFTYSYLDLDVKSFKERCMVLKSDKGQGIVVNKKDYDSLDL